MKRGSALLIILIIILIIGVGSLIVYLVLKPSPDNCGDGTCDNDAGENPKTCPEDCKETLSPTYEDSPFAFQNARITRNSANPLEIWANYPFYLKDLNVHWTRLVGYSAFNWEFAQKSATSNFNWDKFDEDIKDVQKNNVFVLITIQPFARWDQSSCYTIEYLAEHKGNPFSKILPCDLKAYSKFVKAVVERYDGDGIDDMPGLKYAQQYWMIGDEPDHPEFWRDTPEKFATLFATSYKAIKKADPNAKVHMGGTAGCIESYLYREEKITETTRPWNCKEEGKDGFFIRVFTELEKLGGSNTFDIHSVDFHLFGNVGEYKKVKTFSSYINQMTQNFGYGNLPLWSTEIGTFSGEATSSLTGQHGTITYQSETEQAQELIKRYVYGLAWGVKKSFWEAIIAEQTDYFPRISLMDESEIKKLAYYTYKLMVEKLEGSDWDNIQTIQESDDIYIYKFMKQGKPIWVAWSDSGEKQVTINVGSIDSVIITEGVPKYNSGKDVINYSGAFNTKIESVGNNQVAITLTDVPVFVEKI